MIRLLHTSDWHLGGPDEGWPAKSVPTGRLWVDRLRRCREAAVHSVVQLAIRHRADAVLVAGDVFDQPQLPLAVANRAEHFLREDVIGPLRKHRIRLVLTPGTHDWRPEGADRGDSLRRLRRLAREYPADVALLMPPGMPGRRRIDLGKVAISTQRPRFSQPKPWIEFLHDRKASMGGNPICRCYGDQHWVSLDPKRQRYYPGTPLARTTTVDLSGAGPRYAVLVSIDSTFVPRAEPLRLSAAETGVLKWSRDGWEFYYERADARPGGQPKRLGPRVEDALRELASAYPSLSWVTFMVKDDLSRLPPAAVLGDWLRSNKPHMISVWLRDAVR